jgi:hypothetical protein
LIVLLVPIVFESNELGNWPLFSLVVGILSLHVISN